MVMFVAMDIGCLECGEDSAVLGVFDKRSDAEDICDRWDMLGWLGGQHVYEVFEVPAMNVAVTPKVIATAGEKKDE